jgi:hypothetical protein
MEYFTQIATVHPEGDGSDDQKQQGSGLVAAEDFALPWPLY